MKKDKIYQSLLALAFSTITIGVLTLLTYKTNYGLFLIASFGSSMVLLYGTSINLKRFRGNIYLREE